jgi:hypothetical protein
MAENQLVLDAEPEFAPPALTCCVSAKATGGAYHRDGCKAVA